MTIQINQNLKKIIIVCLFFFHQISLKAENYNVGQVTEDNFKIGKRVIIELPEGKFKIFDKFLLFFGSKKIALSGFCSKCTLIFDKMIFLL